MRLGRAPFSEQSLRRNNCSPPRLSPTRLFIKADTQCCLCNYLMCEEGIGRVNAAQTRVAHQALVARRAKNSETTSDIETSVHDAPRALDGAVFGSKNL